MTAYKVVTGYEKDSYGCKAEKAKYFFNKKDAEDFQKEGGIMWEQSDRVGYWYTLEKIEIN